MCLGRKLRVGGKVNETIFDLLIQVETEEN